MNPLNVSLIEGNVCRDAEVKYVNSGTAICKFSIAVNRYYKTANAFENEVSYFDVDTFGEVAKLCGEKCKKGIGVRIHGRLKQNRWQASDGTNRSSVIVIAEHVEFRQKTQGKDEAPDSDVDF